MKRWTQFAVCLMVWPCGAGVTRALCGPWQPSTHAVRLRSRRGSRAGRIAPALQPFIQSEPRTVAFGLVKVVCMVAAGMYLGDEIGDYIKNILRTEFDFPEPDEYEADDDHTIPVHF